MDEFGYLSVLVSIILGFAMTEVLRGLAVVVRQRTRVRHYWPAIAWAGFTLVVAVQMWWSSFDLRHQTTWTFASFGVVLLQVVLLYMFAALVLPDVAAGEADLKANYYAQRRWLFGILLALLGVSVLKNVALYGRLPETGDLAFHTVFAAICVAGMASAREAVHKVLAIAVAGGITLYIALLFASLR